MRSRWSPSIFDPSLRLNATEIRTLLSAAQWAPSAGNMQPWRFVVAERGDSTHRLLVTHLSRGNSGWVPSASVVFLAATEIEDEFGALLEGKFDAVSNLYCLGQAAANLTLQAHAMGLSAHQFAGFDQAAFAAAIGAPRQVRFVAAIAVGQRGDPRHAPEREQDRERKERRRQPLRTIAFGTAWGRPWAPIESGTCDDSLDEGGPATAESEIQDLPHDGASSRQSP